MIQIINIGIPKKRGGQNTNFSLDDSAADEAVNVVRIDEVLRSRSRACCITPHTNSTTGFE